ncbi:MAG: NAD-dependent epimerase/dehydratase family protein [Bdellovibrio sp.]
MKIFITGGSGFLGKQVIKRLITEGHSVTALARSESSRKIVEQLGATAQSGDIHEIKSFFDVLKTFDIVIHAAAPVEFWGPWQKYQAGIIDSTLELANACAQQGVKRFIHISSESVLQDKEPLLNINEDYAYPDQPNSFYGKAKKIVEQKLLQLNCQMEIIILRPTFI